MAGSTAPKKIAKFVANINNAGLAAICASSLAMFGLPVMWVAGILLSFYALEKTTSNFIAVFFAAIIPSVIAFFVLDNELSWQIFWQIFSFLSILSFLSYLLRSTSSWSVVLQAVGILGPCLIILIYILYPDIDAWWLERLNSFFANAEVEQSEIDLALYAKYATGMQAIILYSAALFNLAVARYWQACLYSKKKKARADFLQVKISTLTVFFMLILAVAYIFDFAWALDAFIVSMIPCFCVGAAIIHILCEKNVRKKNRLFFLITFYMMNLIAFPFVPLLIIVLGLADYIFSLRSYFGLVYK
jgi:hypothetical protein